MKILKHTISLMLMLTLFASCNNDGPSEPTNPSAPSASAPESQSVLVGESVELTFSITVDGGYESSAITAANGEATISSEPKAGATSGDIVVSYTATSSGAGSVELVITDADGLSGNATAVINIDEEKTTYTINDNITEDTTWQDGKTYVLGGRVIVEPGVTLTIEGGTVVKGETGSGSNASTLIVARDATLNANGTADAPIIFTSVADEITPEMVDNGEFGSPNLEPDVKGLWGGVIVLGNALISVSSGSEAQIEGIPSSETLALYGGNDSGDSSGSITYITIRHGGSNIGEGNEINGLSLGGVGTGTTIENIEVVANQDDGIEFFGGTVNVSNVLVWNNGDDAIDTDQAWAGTIDNMVLVNPGETAFELDGPEGSYTSSGHTITNATCYMSATSEEIIDVDAETDVNMSNILFYGMPSEDDNGTTVAGIVMSSDYADFASNSNGYEITSVEAVIPSGLALADYFTGGSDSQVTAVADLSAATVGATDVSQFSFTWASKSGALADIGLE